MIDSLTPGGTETSTVALAGELVALGHEASLVVLRHEAHSLRDVATAGGVDVYEIPPGRVLHQIRSVRSAIRQCEPSIVHTALYRADQVGRLAAVGLGVPVVSSFVSTPYDGRRYADPSLRRWKLRVVHWIDAVTAHLFVDRFHAVSQGVAAENGRALRLRPERIGVVQRGRRESDFVAPDPERIARLRSELGIGDNDAVLVNVGRLDRLKGQVRLIEAVAGLLPDLPHLKLLIAGKPGSASDDVAAYLERHPDVARHVRVLGHRNDVGTLLHLADVLVVSSTVEGTAGAAIEAMAAGTPVVSTKVSGAVGILEDGRNAVLVDHDAGAIAAGIRRVLDAPSMARRLGEEGRADFVNRFTLESATRALLDFYGSVVSPPPRARRPTLRRRRRS